MTSAALAVEASKRPVSCLAAKGGDDQHKICGAALARLGMNGS